MLEFHICPPKIMAMPNKETQNAPPNEIAILTVMVALSTKNVCYHSIQELKFVLGYLSCGSAQRTRSRCPVKGAGPWLNFFLIDLWERGLTHFSA
jgi:hypothetical protein